MDKATNAGSSGWDKNAIVADCPVDASTGLSAPEQAQIVVGEHLRVPGEAPDCDAVTGGRDVLDTRVLLQPPDGTEPP